MTPTESEIQAAREALEEVHEIPERARDFLNRSPGYVLPHGVPYLGMGSSYFAPLAFKYMGVDIFPEMASEYACYSDREKTPPLGVILSQSGRTSEALWCTTMFDRFVGVTNAPESPLGQAPNVSAVIPLLAGMEQHSSSKTYINTLLALFKGFGINAERTVDLLREKMRTYAIQGQTLAEEVCEIITRKSIHGVFILGSGPNIATALEASLIMSESAKRPFIGMPLAQYDHGPKETAANSVVMMILARGNSYDRSLKLAETVSRAGARVIRVGEPDAEENLSVIPNIVPFNFMACHLARMLNVTQTFVVGGKVTEVPAKVPMAGREA